MRVGCGEQSLVGCVAGDGVGARQSGGLRGKRCPPRGAALLHRLSPPQTLPAYGRGYCAVSRIDGGAMVVVTKGVGAAVPLLERRLERRVLFSEDNFRRLVIRGLREVGVDAARVKFEYPHPANSRKGQRTDAVILDANGKPETAIEFKYHRNEPNTTMSAGELIADFAKLRDFRNVQRFVVYLTDREMFRYLNDNGLDWLFSPSEQEISDSNIPRTKTVRCYADDWRSPVRAQVAGRWDVGSGHKLIVWRVMA